MGSIGEYPREIVVKWGLKSKKEGKKALFFHEKWLQMKKYGILELFKGKNKKYRGTIYERIRIHTDDLVSARVFLCCFHDHHGL